MNKLSNISIAGANVLSANMMTHTVILISLAVLSGIVDAKSKEDWTGVYGGLNTGVIFNDASINSNNLGLTMPDGTCNTSSNFSSFFSGFQLGYTRQFTSKVVLGLEADYTYAFNKQGRAFCVCDVNEEVSDQFAITNQQQGSLRGRIGYALGEHLLPFVMVGKNLANVSINYRNEDGDYYSKNTSTLGWLVGAGLEWHVTQAWSIRAEYSYIAYDNALNMKIPIIYGLYDPNGSARVNLHTNTLGVAFNYWF